MNLYVYCTYYVFDENSQISILERLQKLRDDFKAIEMLNRQRTIEKLTRDN